MPALRALRALAPRHELAALVTQPDRPKGRSRRPVPPPAAVAARELGLPEEAILQPASPREPGLAAALRALEPDLFCVVAYGGLLTTELLAVPRLYALNAHGSLLPRHRGASCVAAAVAAGDVESGVTVFRMERRLDAGPLLLQKKIRIASRETAETLHGKLAELSAVCLTEAVETVAAGKAVFTPQDNSAASYAPKMTKEDGRLNWSLSARELDRVVRSVAPWPGAWTVVEAVRQDVKGVKKIMRLRIMAAEPAAENPAAPHENGAWQNLLRNTPGWMMPVRLATGEKVLALRCGRAGELGGKWGDSFLLAARVQPESRRPMSAGDFLRGAGRAFVGGGICL